MAERRCDNCTHSKPAELEGMIYCAWPVPIWIIQLTSDYTTRDKALLYSNDGKDCPTWHPRSETQAG